MSRHPLFEGLIDYAGVFPPANLAVPAAVAEYEACRQGDDGWVLGPFLLRASQLGELGEFAAPLGAVLDVPLEQSPTPLLQVESRLEPGAQPEVGLLRTLAPVAYLESTEPDDVFVVDRVAAARRTGYDVRAKIRTGGATAAAFPSVESVTAFVLECVTEDVPFKATAGLHHPFRRPSAVHGAVEHGFVNLIAAVRCALGSPQHVASSLEEFDPDAFDLDTLSWKGVGVDVPEARVREVLCSIGSCSFTEPTGYLHELGVL